MTATLSIIGAGKVGKVLGQQFFRHGVFTPLDILNRSMESSQLSCHFIGAGKAVSSYSDLRPADVFMLSVPDDQIKACSSLLQQQGLMTADTLVFHCSGAFGADELELPTGAASVHPVRSFADPAFVASHFINTICSVEGDSKAREILTQALIQIGAQVVSLEKEGKTIYHAAAVFASNYLVTLMDVALTTFEAAGISPEMARHMAEPLARETLNNVFRLGTQQALTGPIARGDFLTVERHHHVLMQQNKESAALYEMLAKATVNMKDRK